MFDILIMAYLVFVGIVAFNAIWRYVAGRMLARRQINARLAQLRKPVFGEVTCYIEDDALFKKVVAEKAITDAWLQNIYEKAKAQC